VCILLQQNTGIIVSTIKINRPAENINKVHQISTETESLLILQRFTPPIKSEAQTGLCFEIKEKGVHNAYQRSAISTVKSPAISEQVRLGISQAGDQLA
jgi:hypothetical protein